MIKTPLLALIASLLCAPAIAGQAGSYIGLDGASIAVQSQQNDDLNPRGMRLRFGVRVNEFFDMEAHLGGGTDSETTSFESFSTTYAGAYLKGYLPFGRRSSVFALAGLSGVTHSQDVSGRSFTDSQSGFSYGFGMETQLSKQFDLSADFMSYTNDGADFSDVTAVSFGIKWYF